MNKIKRSEISNMPFDKLLDEMPLTVVSHGNPVYSLSDSPTGRVKGKLPFNSIKRGSARDVNELIGELKGKSCYQLQKGLNAYTRGDLLEVYVSKP